jgi:hypothetical protein
MRKIIVKLNYNNWEEVEMEVPTLATNSEAKALAIKKFGSNDYVSFREATPLERKKEVSAPIVEVEEEPLF